MKEPIALADIKAGDLIRVEQELDKAHEFRAARDQERNGWGDYYLLDRPKPAVELPTEPTLGWLTYRDTDYPSANPTIELGEWKARADRATVLDVHGLTSVPLAWAIAFTPAAAVPTAALDELREYINGLDFPNTPACRRIDKFLAAVDEAQS